MDEIVTRETRTSVNKMKSVTINVEPQPYSPVTLTTALFLQKTDLFKIEDFDHDTTFQDLLTELETMRGWIVPRDDTVDNVGHRNPQPTVSPELSCPHCLERVQCLHRLNL